MKYRVVKLKDINNILSIPLSEYKRDASTSQEVIYYCNYHKVNELLILDGMRIQSLNLFIPSLFGKIQQNQLDHEWIGIQGYNHYRLKKVLLKD